MGLLSAGGLGDGWGTDSLGHAMFNSSTHRKIALYRALEDAADENGHGTHCGGSIAGSFESGACGVAKTGTHIDKP